MEYINEYLEHKANCEKLCSDFIKSVKKNKSIKGKFNISNENILKDILIYLNVYYYITNENGKITIKSINKFFIQKIQHQKVQS